MEKNHSSNPVLGLNTEIDPDADIGNFCCIGKNSKIGAKAKIGNNVSIGDNVTIGSGAVLEDGISIPSGAKIGSGAFIAKGVVFTNLKYPRESSQERAIIVGRGATISVNSILSDSIQIEDYSFVGAASTVNFNTKAHSLILGSPANHIGWMSRSGQRLELPAEGNATARCVETGETYLLEKDSLRILD